MNRYFVIYNPSSGKEVGFNKIASTASIIMENEDVEFTFYATKQKNDGEKAAMKACLENYDLIIVCGGDGTVNEVVSGIMKSEKKSKLAIMPTGTVNDFAESIKMPKSSIDFAKLLYDKNYRSIDVGKINERYFINVVGGGAFTDVPHNVTIDAKTIFGKYAYYFKAAAEIPGQLENSYNITYTIDGQIKNINTFLFLVLNTSSAGGFKYICPKAKINDGFLDIVIFEKTNNADLLQILTKTFNGNHIEHPKVHYFQAKNIKIESKDEFSIDIDGDFGGFLPIEITSCENSIDILVPKEE